MVEIGTSGNYYAWKNMKSLYSSLISISIQAHKLVLKCRDDLGKRRVLQIKKYLTL